MLRGASNSQKSRGTRCCGEDKAGQWGEGRQAGGLASPLWLLAEGHPSSCLPGTAEPSQRKGHTCSHLGNLPGAETAFLHTPAPRPRTAGPRFPVSPATTHGHMPGFGQWNSGKIDAHHGQAQRSGPPATMVQGPPPPDDLHRSGK